MSTASHPADGRLITGEELARMGDLGRCELIDGRIVRMTPTGYRHGEVEARIAEALATFVRPRKLGRVLTGEVGLYTRRNPDRVRGADVLFISNERYAQRTPGLAYLDVAPELVIEVLSPGDHAAEVQAKVREYLVVGITEVWVADPESSRISIHRSSTDVRVLGEADRLEAGTILPGFEMAVAEVFEES
jgi:Uma2 family endonuclease